MLRAAHLEDRNIDIEIMVVDENDEIMIPNVKIPFNTLAKLLQISPEDCVAGEWARIYGDDWPYRFRSPQYVSNKITNMIRDEMNPKSAARRAIIFAIRLIQAMGYVDAADKLRYIVRLGLGIKEGSRYTPD
jgi:hypothetical protein